MLFFNILIFMMIFFNSFLFKDGTSFAWKSEGKSFEGEALLIVTAIIVIYLCHYIGACYLISQVRSIAIMLTRDPMSVVEGELKYV